MKRLVYILVIISLMVGLVGITGCAGSGVPSATFTITSWYEDSDGFVDICFDVENTGNVDIAYYEVYFQVNYLGGSYRKMDNGVNVKAGTKVSDETAFDAGYKEVTNIEVADWELSTETGLTWNAAGERTNH